MIDTVGIGRMRLYSHVRPGLPAGDYTIELTQEISNDGPVPASQGPIPRTERHFEVTGPQLTLPGTAIHSVFPPPNATGSFEHRLPHIAMKAVTLPWERESNGEPVATRPPWLALVVLTDGEANFQRNASVREVFDDSDLATLDIPADAKCDYLEVTQTTVAKTFPRENELPYLVHVRQVNVNDTEFAGNDDDGLMSVILANRLPLAGKRYAAYLISLEGRFADLPNPPADDISDGVGPASVYDLTLDEMEKNSFSITGESPEYKATKQPMKGGGTGIVAKSGGAYSTLGREAERRSSGWHPGRAKTGLTGPPTASYGTRLFFDDMNLDLIEVEVAKLRFPVLAHWRFTCEGSGDFQALMQCLDVGLLGTIAGTDDDREGCLPRTGPVVVPDVTDTGHTKVQHLTRGGKEVTSWYRSPFTPREVKRIDRQHPYHAADQARSVGGEGIDNLTYAAAFEVGRLLALSDPRFVRDLLQWRRRGFRLSRVGADLDIMDLGLTADLEHAGFIARKLTADLLSAVAADGLIGVGPVIDPTEGLGFRDDDIDVISSGFLIPKRTVELALQTDGASIAPGLSSSIGQVTLEQDFDTLTDLGIEEFEHLAVALEARIKQMAADAVLPDRRVIGRVARDSDAIFEDLMEGEDDA